VCLLDWHLKDFLPDLAEVVSPFFSALSSLSEDRLSSLLSSEEGGKGISSGSPLVGLSEESGASGEIGAEDTLGCEDSVVGAGGGTAGDGGFGWTVGRV
jgi:hypothetical protein